MKTYTIAQIKRDMRAAGSHWFDKHTMAFFKSQIDQNVYQGPGGIYFVSSEKPPHGSRRYSVRQYLPDKQSIQTIGEFCQIRLLQDAQDLAKHRATETQ